MKKGLYSAPDPFSLAPVLSILPNRGKVGRLESLISSLFARYEGVSTRRRARPEGPDSDISKGLATEEAMLKEVLDWLAVEPPKDI